MNPIPELLVDGLTFPECGRWHDNRLWFSDIDEGRVKAVDGAGHCETVVEAPGSVSGLGWTPNGDLLIVGATEHKLFRWDGSWPASSVSMVPSSRGRSTGFVS